MKTRSAFLLTLDGRASDRSIRGTTIDGTCHERRDDPSQYVCLPSDWDGRHGQGPQGPPEGALAACDGLATGTSCSFEAPFGTVAGTCSAGVGDSSQVACRPEWADGERPSGPGGSGPGPGGQAPQQAIAACEGQLVDTACSFESPLGTLSGVCRTGRDGSSLVCAPSNRPSR